MRISDRALVAGFPACSQPLWLGWEVSSLVPQGFSQPSQHSQPRPVCVRVRVCVRAHGHTRARMHAREWIKKRLGRLGRLGRSSQGKAFNFPTSFEGWEEVGNRKEVVAWNE